MIGADSGLANRTARGYNRGMAVPTREQFPSTVEVLIRARFPLAKVLAEPSQFALRINDNVASLENLYRAAVQHPGDVQRQVTRRMVELLRAAEGAPDRDAPLEDVRERIMPMVLSERDCGMSLETMVHQPLVAGLLVAYALDHDRSIAYIPVARFKTWDLSVDELHEQALANLVRRSEAMQWKAAADENGRMMIGLLQTMDGYDASRILLPTLHEALSEHLGSPFAAGIPNRDILLCFRDEPQLVEQIGRQITADYQTLPHQVTPGLLLITPDGIAPYSV